jgi:hypothetical protein
VLGGSLLKNTFQTMASILLLTVASYAGVTVSSPSSGSTVGSPVHFYATGSMTGSVVQMQIYDNGTLKYKVSGSKIDTYLSMASGSHSVTVKSWNNYGQSAYTKLTVNVSGTTSTSTLYFSNIDQMSGWQNCGACAGIGGSGTVVSYSMTQFQGSPSMDGKSAMFWIGSGKAYSDALWWKQLGPQPTKTHFVYDTYFYYTNSGAPQSLEFDVNQALNGQKYTFGTQCSMRGSKQWDVWDSYNKRWISTGIACPPPPTYKWNHLIWEFERVGGKAHFIAITLNGVKHYVNKYYSPHSTTVKELDVAFQMDGNFQQTSYKVWLDKVLLKVW